MIMKLFRIFVQKWNQFGWEDESASNIFRPIKLSFPSQCQNQILKNYFCVSSREREKYSGELIPDQFLILVIIQILEKCIIAMSLRCTCGFLDQMKIGIFKSLKLSLSKTHSAKEDILNLKLSVSNPLIFFYLLKGK